MGDGWSWDNQLFQLVVDGSRRMLISRMEDKDLIKLSEGGI